MHVFANYSSTQGGGALAEAKVEVDSFHRHQELHPIGATFVPAHTQNIAVLFSKM
jgi:hypothetical protein